MPPNDLGKVAIINARLSTRSYRGYRSSDGPLQPTLGSIDIVAAQNAEYARRFVDLGIPSHRISVTGSVKYDGLESDRNNAKTRELRRLLGLAPTDLVFVAGSTMEGEESAVLAAYNTARRQHRGLRLILVPRHAERFDERGSLAEAEQGNGREAQRVDEPDSANVGGAPPIILIDTIGELSAIWGLADVAFVGGSLRAGRGGQNMMEPAAYGAWVMFGPHIANFRETVEQLLKQNAARQVADAEELTRACLPIWTIPNPPPPEAPPGEITCWPSTAPPAELSPSSTASWNRHWPQWQIESKWLLILLVFHRSDAP